MKLIIGLGNPGEKYQSTRHNLGFMVVEHFVKDATSHFKTEKGWKDDKYSRSKVFKTSLDFKTKKEEVIVVKPQTFMNGSGFSVHKLTTDNQMLIADLIVIHDDIDLPLGKVRIRLGGASAGHRGIQSMIDHLKTDQFIRVRLGIGRGKLDAKKPTQHKNLHRHQVEKFVLSLFTKNEERAVKHMIKKSSEALFSLLSVGLEKTTNRYN